MIASIRFAITVGALALSSAVLATDGQPARSITVDQALSKVRTIVASICGRGREFRCSLLTDDRPRRCAFEVGVGFPPDVALDLRIKALWVSLDHRGRLVGIDPKREMSCAQA